MAVLRSPRGCPWDQVQTHESLRPYLIEETYEALDAIDRGDYTALRGELGDVLLQCVFHAQLASDAGRFTITDVVETLVEKLIRRHPHVFRSDGRPLPAHARARQVAATPDRVVDQWSRIKAGEQADAGAVPRVLAGVPRALPALLRAHKIGTRVATVGFDWRNAEEVFDKVAEEIGELRAALAEGPARTTEEMGDVLFSVANLARALGIDPEQALSAANDKFTRRFDGIETLLAQQGRSVHEVALPELEAAWTVVKKADAPAPRRSATRGRPTSKDVPPARRSRR